MQKLPNITDVAGLKGKRVLLRLSLNVPVENGVVLNNFRLDRVIPTIKFLQGQGARVVILGHIGRKKEDTLKPVFDELSQSIQMTWCGDIEVLSSASTKMENGEVLLLENIRRDDREKDNDLGFAKELASYGDIYVNEAFAASHREHSSIVGLAKLLPTYFGPQFIRECEELSQTIEPEHPALFILGGAKFDTKLPLVNKLAANYDKVFIGGALANDIYKVRGYEVGQSLVSDVDLGEYSFETQANIFAPVDVVVSGRDGVRVSLPEGIKSHEKIVDAGPQTIAELQKFLKNAKTVLWNGPLGYYEGGFDTYTKALALAVSESPARSVVGGGDTIASIQDLKLESKFSFISTGGGAMLHFLEYGTLPAIEAAK